MYLACFTRRDCHVLPWLLTMETLEEFALLEIDRFLLYVYFHIHRFLLTHRGLF